MNSPLRIAFVYLISAIAALAASQTASDPFQAGIEAYETGRYIIAKDQFLSALKMEETAAARHNLGLAYLQLDAPAEAIWQLERAQRLDPLNADYRYKLNAAREQLGLFAGLPPWYRLGSERWSIQTWLSIASIAFWLLFASLILPALAGSKVGIWIKSLRLLNIVALLIALAAIWFNLRLQQTGIIIAAENACLHAAPASAAPESGLARPGERGRVLDEYKDFYKIETEGLASGWISADMFRLIVD